MRFSGFAIALSFLALAFSGCLTNDEPVDTANVEGGLANTSAPTGRGRILALEETNQTEAGSGGLDHDHDYWAGRERVTIIERTVSFPAGAGARTAQLKPEAGVIVYEATDALTIALTNPRRSPCALCPDLPDAAGIPGATLLYQHAATTEWVEVGAATWDAPIAIEITNPSQTDMPHATYSLWKFMLRVDDPKASGLQFDAKIDIVRGDADIPLWPGHPAFYTDGHTRRILDRDAIAGEEGIVGGGAASAEPDGPLHPDKVVSYGTRTLYVFVNVTDLKVGSPVDEPTNFYLIHHNASGEFNHTDYFDASGKHPVTQKEHVWVLRVDDNGMDSPYADGSRWDFELAAAFARNTPVLYTTCYRNCATWSANHHITVIASDIELADEEYSE